MINHVSSLVFSHVYQEHAFSWYVEVATEIYFCINEGYPITKVCNQRSKNEHNMCHVLYYGSYTVVVST